MKKIMRDYVSCLPLLLMASTIGLAAPIHDAARSGDMSRLRSLLESDSLLVYARDSAGMTPLHIAAERGQLGAAAQLVARGARVDARDSAGATPLHVVAGPVGPAYLSPTGLEAIHPPLDTVPLAGDVREAAVAAFLIGNRVDVNARDTFGVTPLHRAVAAGRSLVVRVLLTAGADVNARDGNGRTPLHWAAESGNGPMLVQLLNAHGLADPKDRRGITPLQLAALFNRRDIASILLNRGVDVNARNDDGLTALGYALREHDDQMTNVLERAGGQE